MASEYAKVLGGPITLMHLSNSALILEFQKLCFDLERIQVYLVQVVNNMHSESERDSGDFYLTGLFTRVLANYKVILVRHIPKFVELTDLCTD